MLACAGAQQSLACLRRARSTDSRHAHSLQRRATLYVGVLALEIDAKMGLAVCKTLASHSAAKASRSARVPGLPPDKTRAGVLARNPSGEVVSSNIRIPISPQALVSARTGAKKAAPAPRSSHGDCVTRHSSPGKSRRPLRPRKPRARQPIEEAWTMMRRRPARRAPTRPRR